MSLRAIDLQRLSPPAFLGISFCVIGLVDKGFVTRKFYGDINISSFGQGFDFTDS